MKVKQFLNRYIVYRSKCKKAVVIDVLTGNRHPLTEREISECVYGKVGSMKLNTFAITEDTIIIYAE